MDDLEYNGYYADCYVLCDERNEKIIYDFLNFLVPNREESADEYAFPQYDDSKTKTTFKKVSDLIQYLCENTKSEYSIYWSNKTDEGLKGAMVFFTEEKKLILGLYCHTIKGNTKIEDNYLKQLKEFSNSEFGYITYEETPIMETNEFIKRSKK